MDELGEFPSTVLDNLRQPLEEGVIRVSRAAAKATFPARVLLVGAMNPCPCGEGAGHGTCRCSTHAALRYARKVSAPLLDRFDLRIEVGRPDVGDLLSPPAGESTAAVAARVAAARDRAARRGVEANAELASSRLQDEAPFDDGALRLVEQSLRLGRLTGRGLDAVRRVALTVADLAEESPPLTIDHVSAAMSLRVTPSFVAGRAA
jgi:magnesium chelatase family protein